MVSRKGLNGVHETIHGAHELLKGVEAVIASDGVMKDTPQPLDAIDPRMVGGLEEQVELGVRRQPPCGDGALVDDVLSTMSTMRRARRYKRLIRQRRWTNRHEFLASCSPETTRPVRACRAPAR